MNTHNNNKLLHLHPTYAPSPLPPLVGVDAAVRQTYCEISNRYCFCVARLRRIECNPEYICKPRSTQIRQIRRKHISGYCALHCRCVIFHNPPSTLATANASALHIIPCSNIHVYLLDARRQRSADGISRRRRCLLQHIFGGGWLVCEGGTVCIDLAAGVLAGWRKSCVLIFDCCCPSEPMRDGTARSQRQRTPSSGIRTDESWRPYMGP